MSELSTTTGESCANCSAPLHGPFCYACGQPKKGLIRHFSGIIGDFLDSVFNWDSRTLRTLVPLFLRPGFLSNEYFAGRRVRYVTPLRLYIFLSVVTFLVISLMATPGKPGESLIRIGGDDRPARTEAEREEQLKAIEQGLVMLPEGERRKIVDEARREMIAEAAEPAPKDAVPTDAAPTGAAPTDAAPTDAAPVDAAPTDATPAEAASAETGSPRSAIPEASESDDEEDINLSFNGKRWHKTENPLTFSWLPDSLNVALNEEIEEVVGKAKGVNKDPRPFVEEVFSIAPQALLIVLPLFALLLKVMYLFKRRLYMEHLIVALHSHSFLCVSLLLLLGLSALEDAFASGVARGTVEVLLAVVWVWIPIYLFVMQKRVYRQGWIMTSLKFVVIGTIYTILLSFGLVATMIAGLVFL